MAAKLMGSGDCERIRAGWMAQPFNALTSLAFVVAGARTLHARKGPVDAERIGLAAAAAATGIGSFLWHGPQPRGAQRLHDGSMVWLMVQVLLLRDGHRHERRSAFTHLEATATAVGALWAIRAQRTRPAMKVAAAAVAAKELRAWQRGRRPRAAGNPYGRALAALVASAAALALGRTGSPLCDPDRFVQPHGLWHVGAALALDGYARAMDRPAASSAEHTTGC